MEGNKQKISRKNYTVLGHIVVWVLVLTVPVLLGDLENFRNFSLRHGFSVLLLAVVFYLNYFFLIPRLFFNDKKWKYYLSIFVVLAAIWFTSSQFDNKPPMPQNQNQAERPDELKPDSRSSRRKSFVIMRAIFIVFAGTTASLGMSIGKKYQDEKEARKSLENEQLKSELAMLKYQLQPHFFFNSLNTIYASIDTNPDNAKETVHKLSKLMRYLLYRANDPEVTLADEITFIKAYIELMTARVSENVNVETYFPKGNLDDILVEPLLFISLIENAFKHGISPNLPSEIKIFLEVLNNKKIVCRVSNTHFPKTETDQSGSGIGLVNLNKRLEKLYPKGNFELSQNIENGVYMTQLILL